jgi:hypothetical protein
VIYGLDYEPLENGKTSGGRSVIAGVNAGGELVYGSL